MPAPSPAARPRLNAIAGPILGEFLLGITVAMAGLWLASTISDATAGAFGMANQVLETLFVIFRVLAIGLSVVITQALGGNQPQVVQRTALGALAASTWAGLIAAAAAMFGNQLILDLLNAPDAVRPLAAPYLQLLAPALVLEAYNLSMAAILRAHLHVRDSLFVMVIMHLTHLLLAVLLMRGFWGWGGFGLYGYALAMFLSRGAGLAMHLWLWRRRMQLVPQRRDWSVLPLRTMLPVLRVGLPGAGNEFVYRLAFMVSLAATARLGMEALATHSYTLQLLRYVVLISLSIGWACEILVGRLIGAGQFRMANGLVRKGVRSGLIASGLLALTVALASPWLLRLFTHDPVIIRGAQVLLWMSLALETGRVFNLVVIGALRATGDSVFPVIAGMSSQVLILGFGSFWLGRWFGLPGIWLAYSLDEWVRGLMMMGRWLRRGWLPHARETQRRLRQGA
jgi:putative MATE family efflux protein